MPPPAKPTAKKATEPQAKQSVSKPLTAPQKALRKLGLNRAIDLALHLPLRYEDETRIVRLAETREGDVAQIEATVTSCEVAYKPRRQLLVVVDDGSDSCTLRFFNFYPSQQKALAVGNRLRLRGEVRGGFMGRTMMHPSFHAAGGELPNALTPIYPTSAGLPQSYLRKAVHGGVLHAARQGEFVETIPSGLAPPSLAQSNTKTWGLEQSLHFLHHPTPDVSLAQLEDRTHPAWQRLKAEELLAQQLSQLQSKRERATLRAPSLLHSYFKPRRQRGGRGETGERKEAAMASGHAGCLYVGRAPTLWPILMRSDVLSAPAVATRRPVVVRGWRVLRGLGSSLHASLVWVGRETKGGTGTGLFTVLLVGRLPCQRVAGRRRAA